MTPPAALLPADLAAHTVESLYAEHGAQRPWTHWLAGVIGGLASLPLIKVDVSVSAAGLVHHCSRWNGDSRLLCST